MIIDTSFEDKLLGGLFRSSEFCWVATQRITHIYFEGTMGYNLGMVVTDFHQRIALGCLFIRFVKNGVTFTKPKYFNISIFL
ncbi:MAG: hypothetical protein ABSB79_06810 [Syntrophales bacterium]|jgi:hypothetical protein